MTTEEAKKEAVRKAYGEHWEQVKDYVRMEDGSVLEFKDLEDFDAGLWWRELGYDFGSIEIIIGDWEPTRWRPKSLSGIEDNNGWIRLEPDGSNVPETKGTYRFISKTGYRATIDFEPGDDMSRFTHYRPIEVEPDPLY